MIDTIIRFSIKQRLVVIATTLLLIFAGTAALQKLPIDAMPDISNVQVQVLTSAPSLAPLEVERKVTYPLELSMRGLPGVTQVRSISKFGLSVVTVVFQDTTDIYFARQQVLERLSQARQQIPESIGVPELGPVSTGLGEIYQYQLKSRTGATNAMERRTMQDWFVRRQLLGARGAAEINSYGGLKKQYQVRVDPQKLLSYHLTMRDVLRSVVSNNQNVGGAFIEHQGEQYLLRGIGLAQTPAQISKIVVKTGAEGTPVFVKDVADVVTGAEVRQGAVVANGKGETVAGIVMMLKGENSRTVVENVKQRIAEVQRSLPPDVQLVPFYDRSQLIDRTIHTVESNLLEGAALVIVVLLAILGSWRGALLVASVIPLSMLFAAICMNALNVSGNLMSLGALDFGLIVDGAVVMVENAVGRLNYARATSLDEDARTTILKACLEVGRPVAFAVAIIALVYVPVLSLSGIEGKLFKPMSLTIVFALAGSLLLSLTYVPAMLTLLLDTRPAPVRVKRQTNERAERNNGFGQLLLSGYKWVLQATAKHRPQTVLVCVTLAALSLVTLPMLGAEFIPRLDEGSLAIQMQQAPGTSLPQSIARATSAERVLKSFPEVETVVSKIGRAEVATDPMGVDTADIFVALKPKSQWTTSQTTESLVSRLSQSLQKSIQGAKFSFSQPVELRTSELIAGVRSDVAIKVFGDAPAVLKGLAEQINRVVEQVPGAADTKVEQTSGIPQLIVASNRDLIARHGLNVEDVNDVVESIVAGKPAGQVYQGEQRFGLVVRLDDDKKIDENTIKNLLIGSEKGLRVPLSSVASVRVETGPAQISREDGQRRVVVEVNVRGRDLSSFVNEARSKVERDIKLPPGYYIRWGGQFESLQRASQTLSLVVPAVLLVILLMLYMAFESIAQALLIFSGVPFALAGGIFALALRGMPFSISAGIGMIALSGVAVLNGVVMVSHINSLKPKMETQEAAIAGALTRFRPVMMTALVASLGFVPMAFSTSAGAEVQRPLATVVIGGLLTSTALTLILLPNLYVWFERISGKLSQRANANRVPGSKLSTLPPWKLYDQ